MSGINCILLHWRKNLTFPRYQKPILQTLLTQVLPTIFLTAFSPIKLGNCSSKINCSAICSSHGVVRNSHHFYFIKSNEEGSYRIFVEFYDFHIMDPSKCSIRRFILYFNDSLIHMSVIAHHNLYIDFCTIWYLIHNQIKMPAGILLCLYKMKSITKIPYS